MSREETEPREEIAIVGMAGRFPGAGNVEEFWSNLRQGVESIRAFSPDELAAAGVAPETLANPNFVNSGSVADDLDCFDAGFFGISKREAEVMDPQHRVFLETAWEALENAGYDPERYDGFIGVFGGVAPNTYRSNILNRHPELLAKVGDYLSMISSEKEYAITRVAFKLNLRGPSVSVNTACSTSAVALHLACQSLLAGENDMCLVGGGRVKVPLTAGYIYLEDGIPSNDGHCRAFDADARGTAIGSGVAVIAVKRLSDAIRDGDTIHAVIKSTAVNNDGSAKVGFTAPSVQGQAAVIAEALAMAGVSGDDIQHVETHGTGTSLGDPIEVAALTKAFRQTTDATGFCALGSVKTNIGHLDAGAGIAGVIKTALSLERGEIPPSLHYHSPNPQVDFAHSPFFVNASLRPWPQADVRRAGVSSFGLGGTNAHVVMEEPPQREGSGPSRPHQLLPLSARSDAALDEATRRLGQHLEGCPEQRLADVAFTLQRGRRRFSHRRMLVGGDRSEAAEILKACEPRRLETKVETEEGRPVAFLFPGGGAQYVGMGRQLYAEEPVFKSCIDRCAGLMRDELGRDLRELLFADADLDTATAESERPSQALPMLFAVEYALAQLWMDWGINPSVMIGHSMGEYTAACVAGVITLEQGLGMVALRGRLFEQLPAGAMASLPLTPDEARRYMPAELDLAAVNRPNTCVASGAIAAIEQMQQALESQDIPSTRIHINVAAHSRLVEPILAEFEAHLRTLDLLEPEIPYVSNVTGTWILPEEATDPGYWVAHLRQTVRFSEGLTTLFSDGDQSLLEVGPGQTLSTFARQHPDKRSGQIVVPSLRHPQETVADDAFLLASLERLWMGGADIDWARFNRREVRHRVPLPTYPFERIRYWADSPQANIEAPAQLASPVEFVDEVVAPGVSQEGLAMSEPTTFAECTRKERILQRLREIVEDLTGLSESEIDAHASFLELGLDSLVLTQANTEFQREFDVKITFRQLFESARTLDELAGYIDGQLPEDALPAPPAPVAAVVPATPPAVGDGTPAASSAPVAAGSVEWLIQQQLQIMQQQLAALRDAGGPAGAPAPASPQIATVHRETKGLGPWKPVEKGPDGALTPTQQAHLAALAERFNAKTPESKRLT